MEHIDKGYIAFEFAEDVCDGINVCDDDDFNSGDGNGCVTSLSLSLLRAQSD